MNFTGHNILLDNGQKTMGENVPLLATDGFWISIEKTFNQFFVPDPGQDRAHTKVVDLGCLEGGYATQFARMGFDSLGIEIREENIQKCNYVKSNLNLPNLNFVRDDARNVAKYGKFDISLCYGLLYHLDDPISLINSLGSCTKKILFLNTHYAPEHDFTYWMGKFANRYIVSKLQKNLSFIDHRRNYRLSSIQLNEGYRGRWYNEYPKNEKQDVIDKYLWTSYNNYRSFWLCKRDLVKALHNAGFNSVFEQFNFTGGLGVENYHEYYSRGMFVCIKA